MPGRGAAAHPGKTKSPRRSCGAGCNSTGIWSGRRGPSTERSGRGAVVVVGRAVGPRPMSGCGPGTRATCSVVLSGAFEAYLGRFVNFLSPALFPPHMPQSPGVITWAHGMEVMELEPPDRQNHPERPLWPREIISPRPRHRAPVGALR
jgi:hypothetical protein